MIYTTRKNDKEVRRFYHKKIRDDNESFQEGGLKQKVKERYAI